MISTAENHTGGKAQDYGALDRSALTMRRPSSGSCIHLSPDFKSDVRLPNPFNFTAQRASPVPHLHASLDLKTYVLGGANAQAASLFPHTAAVTELGTPEPTVRSNGSASVRRISSNNTTTADYSGPARHDNGSDTKRSRARSPLPKQKPRMSLSVATEPQRLSSQLPTQHLPPLSPFPHQPPIFSRNSSLAAFHLPRNASSNAMRHMSSHVNGLSREMTSDTDSPHFSASPFVTVEELMARSPLKPVHIALSLLAIYLVGAIGFFSNVRGWDFLDAAYFAVATLTTVGYGDLHPESPIEKLFSIVVIILAVSCIATAAGVLLDHFFQGSIEPRSALHSPLRTTLQMLAALAVIIGAGAAPYSLLEDQPWITSLYWASVTITTVGYGDVAPVTRPGRLFAIFYIFIGTLLAARALSGVASLPFKLRQARMENLVEHQFGHFMTRAEYLAIQQKVKTLEIATPGASGVSQAEFILAMLISLGRINEDDIDTCVTSFRQLDISGDGLLCEGDIFNDSFRFPCVAASPMQTPRTQTCAERLASV